MSIVINASYNLTTGKGQTDYQKNVTKIYESLRNNPNTVVVNMLDGAGWTARNSDYKQILNNCHQFLNLNLADKLNDIIKELFNIN